MSMSRREALGAIAGVSVCGAALQGCKKAVAGTAPVQVGDADARFLNRAGFGARPGEISEIKRIGRSAWLDAQMEPGDEPLDLRLALATLPATSLTAWELRDWPKPSVILQAQKADLLHAVFSPWQLRERMVDFWTNHLNIYGNKGLAAYRIPTDQREVVRKHALGLFPAMISASAKSTAMLLYLDQQASHYAKPNENYARELLELHTLGVNGGYTQQDVMEVARCFTGWTEERRSALQRVREEGGLGKVQGTFRYDHRLHDTRSKSVLGHTIPAGGGLEDGERVIEIVTRHPSTARHIARKLCQYFLGEDARQLEDEVTRVYLEEPVGDIGRMLRTILLWDGFDACAPSFKRPFDFVASSLRILDAETDAGAPLLRELDRMGQPTHMWPMPDGYPMDPSSWNGSVLGRWNFAVRLCSNRIKGTSVDFDRLATQYGVSDLKDWVRLVMQGVPTQIGDIVDAVKGLSFAEKGRFQAAAGICLCSPGFQWK